MNETELREFERAVDAAEDRDAPESNWLITGHRCPFFGESVPCVSFKAAERFSDNWGGQIIRR